MNIILIGVRGSGKTAIGRVLAQILAQPFIDLDDRTLARFQQPTIRDVWIERGEREWRNAETAALQEVLQLDQQVIALGGGTPMIAEARQHIEDARRNKNACVIYLTCSIQELQQRLMSNPGDRPRLTDAGLADEIASVLAQRHSTYRSLADTQYDTSAALPKQAAQDLKLAVSKAAGGGP